MAITCHDTYEEEGYERSTATPVVGAQCHDPVADAYLETLLAEEVRRWAESVAEGDEAAVRAGVNVALLSYERGCGVGAASEEARRLVMSRLRHPSHQRSDPFGQAKAS